MRTSLRRRLVPAVLCGALLFPPPSLAEEAKAERRKEAPHYESPILSLLLLPVNLLIRMASVFETEEGQRKPADSRSGR